MKVTTTGRKVNLRQSFIDKAEKRLQKLDRFFNDEDARADVRVTNEKNRMTAEITVRSKGLVCRAERSAEDIDTAFGDAADLIVKQIVKNKEKLGSRVRKTEVDAASLELADVTPYSEGEYVVSREKHVAINPLSVEEAILQMNMLGHSFFIYSDVDTGETCVVYKRHGDSYGVIVVEK